MLRSRLRAPSSFAPFWLKKSAKPNRKCSKGQNDKFFQIHRVTEGNLTWLTFLSRPTKTYTKRSCRTQRTWNEFPGGRNVVNFRSSGIVASCEKKNALKRIPRKRFVLFYTRETPHLFGFIVTGFTIEICINWCSLWRVFSVTWPAHMQTKESVYIRKEFNWMLALLFTLWNLDNHLNNLRNEVTYSEYCMCLPVIWWHFVPSEESNSNLKLD